MTLPTNGINAINHNTAPVIIKNPNFTIVFSTFNLLHIILFTAITNIEELIAQATNNNAKPSNETEDVIFNSNNITSAIISTIGVNIPNAIVDGSFLVSTKLVRSKNLGASHKPISQIIKTVTKNPPIESRYVCIDGDEVFNCV